MALNLSHRPIFREGCSENHGERFCSPLISEGEFKDCFDYGRDRNTTGGSSQELISSGDIIGGLPPDPFGMEMNTTFTAITGWLENLEVDYFGYGGNRAGNSAWDYQLFTGLDFLWNNAMLFHALPDSVLFDCGSYVPNGIGESSRVTPSPVDGTHRCSDTMETKSHLEFGLNCGLEGFSEIKAAWGFSCHHMYESTTRFGTYANQSEISMRSDASCGVLDFPPMREIDSVSSIGFVLREGFDGCPEKIQSESVSPCCSDGDGVSHLALDFVLGFLTVKDLLSIERVCKSLKSTVRTDALLWQSIYIGHPLNEKITDDILLQLSARAQGNLKCLTLVECSRITNDCLKRVVLSNPTLTKLYVPGCSSLSISVILNILKTLQSMGILSVKHVRIGGIYGITIDQFEELKTLLGLDCKQQHTHRPHFFQREKYLSFEDDSEIDIEICPRCQNLRLVYDCPSETCRGNLDGAVTCRACILCNPRCFQCGLCINDGEYQENFCLELLCPDCSVPGGVLHPRIV